VRQALLERAAHLVAARKPVTLRGLAADVGTSTMSIYTHFGSMEELLREVRREGFSRLAAHLAEVPDTKDPVSDLVALGWAYCLNAVANPDMYRVMFLDTSADMEEAAFGAATFLPVLSNVERCIETGRLTAPSAWAVSVELWALTHGMVTLAIGGMLTVDDLLEHLHGAIRACLIGYGDEPAKTDRSIRRVRRRMESTTVLPKLPDKGATLSVATRKAARDRR
jgi:AcrR family transcriptional regulator